MILVTGASGFVGRQLVMSLVDDNCPVRIATRQAGADWPADVEEISGCDLSREDNWAKALAGVKCVIHCAAKVQAVNEDADNVHSAFREVNVEGTALLAKLAAEAGVCRFVFLSSVKVNGESTSGRKPYTEQEKPQPIDEYGASKCEAEQEIFKLAEGTGLEWVVVRSPLVYGPGVKGNFQSLMTLVDSPWPLPFYGVNNARSVLYVRNLVQFLKLVSSAPKAKNQIFFVSDREDQSISSLVGALRDELRRPHRLFPFPWNTIISLSKPFNVSMTIAKTVGSLQISTDKARVVLGWEAPYSFKEGLSETVASMKNAC